MSVDGTLSKLITFDNASFEYLIEKNLTAMTTAIERYNIPDVYSLQFIISRLNYQPVPIFLSIDSNSSLVSGSVNYDNFKSIISNAINELVTPTILIFPTKISLRHVIFGGVPYTFTPFYLVVSKLFKEKIKSKQFNSVHIFTNNKRDKFVVRLGKDEESIPDADNDIVLMNSDIMYPLRLPFVNFASYVNVNYMPIVKRLSFIPSETLEKKECDDLFDYFKGSSIYKTETHGILLYKDFIKVKPTNIDVYNSLEFIKENDQQYPVMNVALHMTYTGQKLQYLVMYRYLVT